MKFKVSSQVFDGHSETLKIDKLYVSVKHQGGGIGKQLVEAAIEMLKGESLSSVWASVFKDNVKAADFYEKLGFIKYGEIYFKLAELIMTDFIYLRKL